MIVGSVCSGIGAPEVAWADLGWQFSFASEIDKFPRAVFAHRHPAIPLHGDFTTIEEKQYEPIDLFVGGTPCQSFSVAGLRGGLDDDRGNLALEFLRLAQRKRPRWVLWENVPGVFSSLSHGAADPRPPIIDLDGDDGPKDGAEVVVDDEYDVDENHAFSCFLAGLSELGYGFFYRVLDARYFGVPQRRRRPFVVGYLGDWRPAAAVLLERHCLSGNSPPRRETGPGVAALTANGLGTCGADDNQGQAGHLIPQAFGGNNTGGPIDVATAVNAHGGPHGRQDFESETFVAHTTGAGWWKEGVGTLRGRSQESHEHLVAHSLRGEGFDASEDGTGRGTPIIPIDMRQASRGATMTNNRSKGTTGGAPGTGIGEDGDPSPTMAGSHVPAIAFHGSQDPDVSGDITHPVGRNHGQETCVAIQDSRGINKAQHGRGRNDDGSAYTVDTAATQGIAHDMAVRRLMPIECEALQGFSRNFTQIPWRGKPAIECPDGPRYKALGNSMAVPVMRWIGERIQTVDDIVAERKQHD